MYIMGNNIIAMALNEKQVEDLKYDIKTIACERDVHKITIEHQKAVIQEQLDEIKKLKADKVILQHHIDNRNNTIVMREMRIENLKKQLIEEENNSNLKYVANLLVKIDKQEQRIRDKDSIIAKYTSAA